MTRSIKAVGIYENLVDYDPDWRGGRDCQMWQSNCRWRAKPAGEWWLSSGEYIRRNHPTNFGDHCGMRLCTHLMHRRPGHKPDTR
jgi:hypothetical protein